jgi:hypothetical protein
MVAHFLKESGVIDALMFFQDFSSHSLEEVTDYYNMVAPNLKDASKRQKHFDIIRKVFTEYQLDKIRENCNLHFSEES